MPRTAITLCLALGIASAQATPISLTSSAYTTGVFADVGGTADGPYGDDSSASPLPLITSAGLDLADGLAVANAVADSGLLAASSEALSRGSTASASAVGSFLGRFTTLGTGLSLALDYEDFNDASGAALAGSELFVLLQVDGVDLFNDSFTASELIRLDFPTLAGLEGILDLTLVSTALDEAGDGAFNLASAAFTLNSVPEPASLALVMGGLGLLGFAHSGRFNRAGRNATA